LTATIYLTRLEKKAFDLARQSEIVSRQDHPHRDAAIDREAKLLEWFTEQFEPLVEEFKPFLQLERNDWHDSPRLRRWRAAAAKSVIGRLLQQQQS
jgi:hypothetical protein